MSARVMDALKGLKMKVGHPEPSERLTVSVAMATYNGYAYLPAQLESIARQTELPDELVVCDDGSTDETVDLLNAFAASAPFSVRVYRNERNLGYADNFLKAASLCKGELIAFCDQDDVWLENKLEIAARPFRDTKTLLVVHSGLLWDGSAQRGTALCPAYKELRSYEPLSLYPLASSYGFAMVARRDLLGIVDPAMRPKMIAAHDQWLWFLASVFGKMTLIPDALTLYRQHGANQYGGVQRSRLDDLTQRTSVRDYATTAAKEADAHLFLGEIAPSLEESRRTLARSAAEKMDRAAEINRRRSSLYDPKKSFVWRLSSYISLLKAGGYKKRPGIRLGKFASAKDLALGVLSFRR